MQTPRYHFSIIPHTLRFKRPARTSRGEYVERKVWYIRATDLSAPDVVGLGECAPLPDLSCDAMPDAAYEAVLHSAARHIEATGSIDHEALRDFPSVLFGFECALLSATAARTGESTRLFDTPFARGEKGIPINGLIWMGDKDHMSEQGEEKLQQGFRCIKLKIGALDFEQEYEILRHLRGRFSPEQITLRIDANGAYSPERAMQVLQSLAPLGIHSIEQPIRAGQWDEMRKVCAESPIPVALDEELIGINRTADKIRLLDTIRPQFLVLKPSLHGGIRGTEEWMHLADERHIGYWLTSALESNVGLNAIAHFASRINSPHLLETQGLGTGALFEKNYEGTQLVIEGDELWVKDKAGRDFDNEVSSFIDEWRNEIKTVGVQTSGSTGMPKHINVEKERMRASAKATCDFLHLKKGDKALLCLPMQFIAGKMMAVRAEERGLTLILRKPSGHPLRHIDTPLAFAAFTPMQVHNMLRHPEERERLGSIRQVIIGGGGIPREMAEELKGFKNAVWSTYGMTETLSHIALRRLSGAEASLRYAPLPGISITTDEAGRIVIEAPAVCPETLTTNDIGKMHPDGTFTILGRTDNTICTGSIKVQPEEIEALLCKAGINGIITSVTDAKFGEAVTLLHTSEMNTAELKSLCTHWLRPHEVPRHFIRIAALPLTGNGKISRADARAAAREFINQVPSGLNENP